MKKNADHLRFDARDGTNTTTTIYFWAHQIVDRIVTIFPCKGSDREEIPQKELDFHAEFAEQDCNS